MVKKVCVLLIKRPMSSLFHPEIHSCQGGKASEAACRPLARKGGTLGKARLITFFSAG